MTDLITLYPTDDEDETYYVNKYDDVNDINGPFMTRVIYNNISSDLDYFDTRPLIMALSNYLSNIQVEQIEDVYNFYSIVEGEMFKISINTGSPMLLIINMKYNITNNFETAYIPPHKYPIYQLTSNPVIILLGLMLAVCCVDENHIMNLMSAIYKVAQRISSDEIYYTDPNTMYLLSIYNKQPWINVQDALAEIEKKITIISDEKEQLMMEEMCCQPTYQLQKDNIYANTKTRLKQNKTKLSNYIKLECLLRTFHKDDEILEIDIGNQSHFLLKRGDNIMTIIRDEFNTIQYNILDQDVLTRYIVMETEFAKCITLYDNAESDIYKQLNIDDEYALYS